MQLYILFCSSFALGHAYIPGKPDSNWGVRDRWQRGCEGEMAAAGQERQREIPAEMRKVIEENPPNLQILGWRLNSAFTREDPRLSVRDSSWKAKRSKRLLPAVAGKELGVRVQRVNYLQEKKSSEEVNRILRIYNLHHKHPAYIKIMWLADKQEMWGTVKRKSSQRKLAPKIIKLLELAEERFKKS